jgi:hypothetical protein
MRVAFVEIALGRKRERERRVSPRQLRPPLPRGRRRPSRCQVPLRACLTERPLKKTRKQNVQALWDRYIFNFSRRVNPPPPLLRAASLSVSSAWKGTRGGYENEACPCRGSGSPRTRRVPSCGDARNVASAAAEGQTSAQLGSASGWPRAQYLSARARQSPREAKEESEAELKRAPASVRCEI